MVFRVWLTEANFIGCEFRANKPDEPFAFPEDHFGGSVHFLDVTLWLFFQNEGWIFAEGIPIPACDCSQLILDPNKYASDVLDEHGGRPKGAEAQSVLVGIDKVPLVAKLWPCQLHTPWR